MSSNKRRRSSDSSPSSSSKFAAVSEQQPPTNSMFISLPAPRIPPPQTCQLKRRSPLTPPSVTPPSVTAASMQRRDRYTSPGTRASALLAKVAVVSATPVTAPSSPRMCGASPSSSGLGSNSSTPTSTPPDEGQFPFSLLSKQLPESPNGGYVSFPMFEAFSGDCEHDHDDDSPVSPTQ